MGPNDALRLRIRLVEEAIVRTRLALESLIPGAPAGSTRVDDPAFDAETKVRWAQGRMIEELLELRKLALQQEMQRRRESLEA